MYLFMNSVSCYVNEQNQPLGNSLRWNHELGQKGYDAAKVPRI